MSVLEGSSILITGGTGSFGRAFIAEVLAHHNPKRVAIFSRDELKQYEMKQHYLNDERVRFFLGDIRDRERLRMAMNGVDYVVHAAALKQVDTAEYNPMEFVKTNILGSENVLTTAIDDGVKKVVALSTDKASSPINLYGATKLTADKLFISGNHYSYARGTKLAVVRYGNVMASRGSVIPYWRNLAAQGRPLPITDRRMTRFWITLRQAVDFVIDSFSMMDGGELYVPRIPSMKLTDLAEAIAPGSALEEIGIRPGEKLHEEMISVDDGRMTVMLPERYVIAPALAEWTFRQPKGAEPVPEGFSYSSDSNDLWLTIPELQQMLVDLDSKDTSDV